MIGNREYNETYHVFEKVKSMLKVTVQRYA